MNHPYLILIFRDTEVMTIPFYGVEAAYEAYKGAAKLAPVARVHLIDGDTGEILASTIEDWGE